MLIDIALIVIFAASLFLVWYRVSLKIPEVVAIPDQVITERLHEDSARLRLFLLHIKTYYREGRYRPYIWNFILKSLYRLHLMLLKTDNAVVLYLKSIKTKAESEGIPVIKLNGNGNGHTALNGKDYWQKLQESKEAISPLPPKSRIIEEVRKKEG